MLELKHQIKWAADELLLPSAMSLPLISVLWNLLFSSLTLHAATAHSFSLTGTRSGKSLSLSPLWLWVSVTLFVDGGETVFFSRFFWTIFLTSSSIYSCWSSSLCVIREKYTLEQDIREAEEAIRHKTTEVQVRCQVDMYEAVLAS